MTDARTLVQVPIATRVPFVIHLTTLEDATAPAIDGRELGLGHPGRCQARPRAARRWSREDPLCASIANSHVDYLARLVPVCRIHQAAYARWGVEAERLALELWGWPPAFTTGT
jgi:hypothetical protein